MEQPPQPAETPIVRTRWTTWPTTFDDDAPQRDARWYAAPTRRQRVVRPTLPVLTPYQRACIVAEECIERARRAAAAAAR